MPTQPPVVMLVEDDLALLQAWTDLLEWMGHRVHAFASGSEALAAPEAVQEAEVLLTDYNLGDITGLELIRRVRRHRPALPAAVLTGLRGEGLENLVEAEPDVSLFFKPVPVSTLEAYLQARSSAA